MNKMDSHSKLVSREMLRDLTRRHFFRQSGFGIGTAALTGLLNNQLFANEIASTNPLAPKPPMHPAKAKSIIYLFMAGAPSQVDLIDPKPTLQKYDGQNVPAELTKGERFLARRMSSSVAAPPEQRYRSCCRTCVESPTTSPSSGPCTRRNSITRLRKST
jgi:Protein of unknown function (DUF1501)